MITGTYIDNSNGATLVDAIIEGRHLQIIGETPEIRFNYRIYANQIRYEEDVIYDEEYKTIVGGKNEDGTPDDAANQCYQFIADFHAACQASALDDSATIYERSAEALGFARDEIDDYLLALPEFDGWSKI